MPYFSLPDERQIHYAVTDSGKSPLLMLHGLSQSHATFSGVAQQLATRFEIVTCDLPGHGRSCRPRGYESSALIEDVTALLREVVGQPAVIYGHSLGALVATGIAAREPTLVSKLILSDPPLVIWDESRWPDSVISSYFGWARKTLKAGYGTERIVPMLQAAFPHRSLETLETQAEALAQLDIAILDALFDGAIATRGEVLSLLDGVQCPTLLLQADPRILAAASDADIADIQARIADTHHVKFAGADHDLHMWKPDRIVEAVLRFTQT